MRVPWLNAIAFVAGCGRYGFDPDAGVADLANADTARDAPRPAIAWVQEASSGLTCMAAIDLCTVTFPTRNLPGDVLLVVTTFDNLSASVSAMSDSDGNGYSRLIGPQSWPVSDFRTEVWYTISPGGASSNTITVDYQPTTTSFASLKAHEYTGTDVNSPIDQTAFTSGTTGLAISSGPRTTANNNELIFGHGEGQGPAVTPGPGFTARDTSGGNTDEDRAAGPAGSHDAAFDLNQQGEWIALMVTLK